MLGEELNSILREKAYLLLFIDYLFSDEVFGYANSDCLNVTNSNESFSFIDD
jgi:hypothetical protein